MSNEVPRILDGRWALPGEWRDGGHARVYKASDVTGAIDGRVAIKVVPSAIHGDEGLAMQVFQREYESLTRLEHPSIVELLDGGRDGETNERYFVFPWLDAKLREVLDERPLEGWDDYWTRYGKHLLDALGYAHAAGVAHRDIKPENVMIRADGRPCVTDFGIAKVLSRVAPDVTLRDQVTRPYAPPEYDDGRYPTQRDVYSFAVLALLLLTGIDPFSGYEDDRYRAIEDAWAGLDVPEDVEDVFRRCVHEDPQARPHDAIQLCEELGEIEADRARVRAAEFGMVRSCSLVLTGRATDALLDHLDLETTEEVAAAVFDNLSEESALEPFDGTFADGASTDGHYYLAGTELRLHVRIDDQSRQHLVALNAWPASSSDLERDRDRGWRPPWTWTLDKPLDPDEGEQRMIELEREVSAHAAERGLQRRQRARDRPIKIWRQTLRALRSAESAKESPLRYSDIAETASGIEFEIVTALPEGLIGQFRLTEDVNGQLLTGEITDVGATTVTLMPTRGSFEALPTAGELKMDLRAARSALKRQEQALDALQYDRSLRPELRGLLLDPTSATPPQPVDGITWRGDLDEPKRRAVAAALGTDDLLVVEGPPGTGKTTFITELILQYLERHPRHRILVSSQTNAALDNVLEQLLKADAGLRQTRIARAGDPRIAESVRPLLLDEQIASWRKEVIAKGRKWLEGWSVSRGISVDDLETAMRYEELAAEHEAVEALSSETQDLQSRLDRSPEPVPDATEPDDASVALSDRLDEVREELSAARSSADQAGQRLVELGVVRRRRDLSDAGAAELRERAAEVVPARGAVADECRKLIDLLGDWHARFGRGPAFRGAALMRSQVVAATCVGYASIKGSETIEFDLCIVDEASKATATEMLVPMTRARRWVIVGDNRQLPPFVDEALRDGNLLRKHDLAVDDIGSTLFDRLRTQLPRECVRVLSKQHRMVPSIGGLVSTCFYDGNLESEHRRRPRGLDLVAPKPVCWFTTARSRERFEQKRGKSWINPFEARAVETLLGRLDFAAKATKRKMTVSVLAGYAGQRDLIERQIAGKRRLWPRLEIDCSTVDAFQGRQADVAIYSVTRSNPQGNLGFLSERRRLNVALSRGRDTLILVGDHVAARKARGENPFLPVIDYIEDHPDDCILQEVDT